MGKKISILGATGSIGQSACDVIAANPARFDVQVLTAHSNTEKLAQLAIELGAKKAVIGDISYLSTLQNILHNSKASGGVRAAAGGGKDIKAGVAECGAGGGKDVKADVVECGAGGGKDIKEGVVECGAGGKALMDAARIPADLILNAIVGFAGLKPLMAAIEQGTTVAIANKEPLVAAGPLVMEAAARHRATILPVDSEHNAIFQVFDPAQKEQIKRIVLTASGGPFLHRGDVSAVTPEEAVDHPNWDMGAKISVDSATMMNKALEIIEAHYLFGLPPDKIEVLIHPQSVVHSMVEYADGSVLAQMGASDMRTPIAHVLAYPERMATPGKTLDLSGLRDLTFEEPDLDQFPAIKMAYACLDRGPSACVTFNAANEVMVEAFLKHEIGFPAIIKGVEEALNNHVDKELKTLDDVIAFDHNSRELAAAYISGNTHKKAV